MNVLRRTLKKLVWQIPPLKRAQATIDDLVLERETLWAQRDALVAQRDDVLERYKWLHNRLARMVQMQGDPPGEDFFVRIMREDWDERARLNARHHTATGKRDWSDDDYFRSGDQNVNELIRNDMQNICQGMDPKQMRILEIGCGAGRMTKALASVFGEVYAVDISEEMIRQARQALAGLPNVHLFVNNGQDLSVLPEVRFDFAFSFIVFQHVPLAAIIQNYFSEVHRVLKPGKLFKVQLLGEVPVTALPPDTWVGASFTLGEAQTTSEKCGFEFRHWDDRDGQYLWLWLFRR